MVNELLIGGIIYMKKVLIFTIALILLLTFTITSNAESRLKEFEEGGY